MSNEGSKQAGNIKKKKKHACFGYFLHEECGVEMFIDFFSMRCGS